MSPVRREGAQSIARCRPRSVTPEQFAAPIESDMEKWGDVGKRLGVNLD
jgi:hypothetical protein